MPVDIKDVEIFSAGKSSDGREVTEKELVEIVKNTKELMENSNYKVPLKLGHFDISQYAKGWLSNIRKSGKVIIADFMNVPDEVSEQIKNGYLPNKSVEIWSDFIGADGKKYGKVLGAVALLGIDTPAIPWLSDTKFEHRIYYTIKSVNQQEVKTMDEQLAKLNEKFERLVDAISDKDKKNEIAEYKKEFELIKSNYVAKDEYERVTSDYNKMKTEYEALSESNKKLEDAINVIKSKNREDFFANAVTRGHLKPTQKEYFFKMCDNLGDNDAYAFVNELPISQSQANLTSEQTGSANSIFNNLSDKDKQHYQILKDAGIPDTQIISELGIKVKGEA